MAGGGAIEMELSRHLREHSRTIAGKEQLLIAAMAKAFEVIPRQLCDNAGFDSTIILNKLRQKHASGRSCFTNFNEGFCHYIPLPSSPFRFFGKFSDANVERYKEVFKYKGTLIDPSKIFTGKWE